MKSNSKKKIITLGVVFGLIMLIACDVNFVSAQSDTPRTGGTFTLGILSDMKRGFLHLT